MSEFGERWDSGMPLSLCDWLPLLDPPAKIERIKHTPEEDAEYLRVWLAVIEAFAGRQ